MKVEVFWWSGRTRSPTLLKEQKGAHPKLSTFNSKAAGK